MFARVVEPKSHEGGFLLSCTGSSPALEPVIIHADTGICTGYVVSVIGNTNSPLAHVPHVDRHLDLDSIVCINVAHRVKNTREERRMRESVIRGRSG